MKFLILFLYLYVYVCFEYVSVLMLKAPLKFSQMFIHTLEWGTVKGRDHPMCVRRITQQMDYSVAGILVVSGLAFHVGGSNTYIYISILLCYVISEKNPSACILGYTKLAAGILSQEGKQAGELLTDAKLIWPSRF